VLGNTFEKQAEHHPSFVGEGCSTERMKMDAINLHVRRCLLGEVDKDDNLNTMMVERADGALMPSFSPCPPCYAKEFPKNNIPLSSSIRLLESRNVRSAPMLCTQSLLEKEETGNRTVIIINVVVGKEGCQIKEEDRTSEFAMILVGESRKILLIISATSTSTKRN